MWYAVRCGDSIFNLGHTFTKAALYRRARSMQELGEPPVVEEQRPIRQTVSKITAFNRTFERAGQGMTCAIFLEGDIDFDPLNWCFGTDEHELQVIICERFSQYTEGEIPRPAPAPVRTECGAEQESG